ncbi:MAG: hypothetical protein DME09_18870 [Candidatus Rokuibacteriota bacterium]|nr:MAG: hypothetical protein DME09_18870 [Candidatus Rokubacteria bacterium]
MKKGLAVLVTLVFMTGVAGAVLAQDKKAMDAMDKPADAKAMAMKAHYANGTVKSAAADSFVVTAKEAEWTFSVDSKTTIRRAGRAINAADIQPGDWVSVKYMDHDGKAVAERVAVKPGKKMAGAKNPCAAKK